MRVRIDDRIGMPTPSSLSVAGIMSEAKCPLGFTGTPPIGHPVMPGMKGSSSAAGSWTSNLASYRPSTLLIVDAVFLGLCIIAAVYRDDLKALLGKSSPPPVTSK
jgi:hypothetical protein